MVRMEKIRFRLDAEEQRLLDGLKALGFECDEDALRQAALVWIEAKMKERPTQDPTSALRRKKPRRTRGGSGN